MSVIGVVAEYNPFHNGHAYMLRQARAQAGAQAAVAVMSGSFVQRAEPAVIPKAARVEAALRGGVDLVLELPVDFAVASAEGFARGAVWILHALGVVDFLAFGCEAGEAAPLVQLAALLRAPAFSAALRPYLDGGMAFAAARQAAVERLAGEDTAALLAQPNNLLAVEYCKALAEFDSPMQPLAVQRQGAAHGAAAPAGTFASAQYLRGLLRAGETGWEAFVPEGSARVLHREMARGHLARERDAVQLGRLRALDEDALAQLPGMREGLEHRLARAIAAGTSLQEVYSYAKSKRYAHSAIRRLCLAAFLGLRAQPLDALPPAIRVLGFTQTGAALLREAKQEARLPIVTKAADAGQAGEQTRHMLEKESAATDAFGLLTDQILPCGEEYRNFPVKI